MGKQEEEGNEEEEEGAKTDRDNKHVFMNDSIREMQCGFTFKMSCIYTLMLYN